MCLEEVEGYRKCNISYNLIYDITDIKERMRAEKAIINRKEEKWSGMAAAEGRKRESKILEKHELIQYKEL